MSLLEEIRKFFASMSKGAAQLKTLPDGYPAYIVRLSDGFGVAVEWDSENDISEHFANAHFFSSKMLLGGEEKKLLMLLSFREDLRNEFACVCAQLVEPGRDGKERADLLADPLTWWKNWKNLLGNAINDHTPYSVIAELIVLEHIFKTDKSAQWTATKAGTHDIEADLRSYEVKSTIKRYGADVTISGQFQLLTPKPLDLYFCRMEESPAGISINEMKDRLISAGYDEGIIEQQLFAQGFEAGSSARDLKYSVLEKRVYAIDENFPKITAESFKNDAIPQGITHISYSVDLDSVSYLSW